MKKSKIEYTIKVEHRKGFWWTALFWSMLFTIGLIQVIFYWTGKGFTTASDLLRELCYRAWFRSLTELKK